MLDHIVCVNLETCLENLADNPGLPAHVQCSTIWIDTTVLPQLQLQCHKWLACSQMIHDTHKPGPHTAALLTVRYASGLPTACTAVCSACSTEVHFCLTCWEPLDPFYWILSTPNMQRNTHCLLSTGVLYHLLLLLQLARRSTRKSLASTTAGYQSSAVHRHCAAHPLQLPTGTSLLLAPCWPWGC
jgi:hypothetical protein